MTKEEKEGTNQDYFASDTKKSAAEKEPVVAKGKAAKASKTDTNWKSLIMTSATTQNMLQMLQI